MVGRKMMTGSSRTMMACQDRRMVDSQAGTMSTGGGTMTSQSVVSLGAPPMHKAEKGHCEETDRSDQQEQ